MGLKFGIAILTLNLGNDFIEELDKWKKNIIINEENIKDRLKQLIKEDNKKLGKKNG